MKPPIRKLPSFIPLVVRAGLAQRRWESLAATAGVESTVDERLRAKNTKLRKHGWSHERRAVRQLLRNSVVH